MTLLAVPAALPVAADPLIRLQALADRLEAAHGQDPGNALLARELRATLLALAGGDDDSLFDAG